MSEMVILVDQNDNEVGTGEKMKIHEEGRLHRAFSIFVFNSKGETLLQKRAKSKYHSGGLWSNTCCSHPRPGEDTEQAAHRRLKEEMGFDCDLKKIFAFVYKANLDHNLTEYEFDHVFVGNYDGKVEINPMEAEDYKWVNMKTLKDNVEKHPEKYTVWFKIAFNEILKFLSD
ncbi:MAG: isopentenyl-diphosphate Delta-isomerase [Candidatus Freyarchaeota archaeon]|nr:isopentenyl-diphosphate Delta-isomerase [Candidatus Jordarchaeia archaeon]MBS7269572.1 isopentenyl-diphosphate Delta-isomerase [Candidatus Jordarchaeia archaeon]MBS7280327.1 isopentenyl-diphosphate Delta-isomerase [Candidatus Jordarchaeia archaeon]